VSVAAEFSIAPSLFLFAGFTSAGTEKTRWTWKLWITIDAYENDQTAAPSSGGNSPRRIYAAAPRQ
jgi:hypothetical protein